MAQRKTAERVIEGFFLFCALLSILTVVFITFFIMLEGLPLFFETAGDWDPPSLGEFLFGPNYFPTERPPVFGILPFIVGSIFVTLGALVLAVPIGVGVGIFIAEIAKGPWQRVLRRVTEILAGIPSVVYGFFGVMMIGISLDIGLQIGNLDPLVNYNVFSASVILAIMTLPTIINVTEVSIRSVNPDFAQGSMAMGSTHWQTIMRVQVPAARSGIITGVILGMGRAIGETMAVLMVAGNQPTLPDSFLRSRVRTMTMAVVNDMGYAADDHRVSLFTIAIVLFFFIMVLNVITQIITRRSNIQVA